MKTESEEFADGRRELVISRQSEHVRFREETVAAMNDAKAGNLEGPIDTSSVEAMLKSMNL